MPDSVKFPTPGAKSGVKSLGKSPMLPVGGGGGGGGVGQHIDRCIMATLYVCIPTRYKDHTLCVYTYQI